MSEAESLLWVALIVFCLTGANVRHAHRERVRTHAMAQHYLGEVKRAFVLMRGGDKDEAIAVLERAVREFEKT